MSKKRSQTARSGRRRGERSRRVRVNELVDQAALEDVFRAIERFSELDWVTIAPSVVPMLPRRRPMPMPGGRPVEVLLPPGVMTGFGVDAGPAVMHVGEEALRLWDVGTPELVARALGNLRLRTELVRPRDLIVQSVEGVTIRALQTVEGCASTLLLVPDEIERIFGPQPQRFIAPMRDLLVSVAGAIDPGYLAWLNEEFAALDPNALALDAFCLRDGQLRLEPLSERAALA